jgi:hypothetical protein
MKHHYSQIMRTLAFVAASAVAGMVTTDSLTAQVTARGTIYNRLTDQCLQPVSGSTALGAAIVLEPCDGSPAQQWYRFIVSSNNDHYVNVLTGMCLDARGGAANNTPVQQWVCDSITNENWQYAQGAGETSLPRVKSRVSGTDDFCLDIPVGQVAPGTAVQIYSCNGALSQNWFTP